MIDYENPWIYKGRAFLSEDIGNNYGFVYKITNILNGREYIGRKYFVQKRKPKGGKRRESLLSLIGRSTMGLALS